MITSQSILGELLFNPTTIQTSKVFDPKLSKCYLTAYKKYADQQGYKLKKMNFNFVGPCISGDAYQTAFYINNALQTIAGVNIQIQLFTVEEFISKLMSAIPDDKWYIKKATPNNIVSKANFQTLESKGLANLI